jgi:tetratricopeptide (TPR) repeat protein
MSDAVSVQYQEALRRGHVAAVKGRPKEAVKQYQEAAAVAGDRPLPFVSMGSVFLQMSRPKDALRAYDEALQRAPDDPDALRGRAMALEAAGRREEAAAATAKLNGLQRSAIPPPGLAAPLDPRKAELERAVAAGHAARVAGDGRMAVQAYLAAANGYAGLNDSDTAIDACFRALSIKPGHIDAHFTLAMLYLRRGWIDLGVERIQLIQRRLDVDDDPRRRAALHALARDHRASSPELQRLAAAPD